MPRNLDTALLRSFLAVVQAGGMTRAALALHLTQAAVSQQIKRLEEGLGCALFVRDRQGMALTPAGERLLVRAQRFMALNDEIWTTMTAPEFEGEVRLGVPHDIIGPLLPAVLRAFNRDWPRVRITLESSATSWSLRQALARGELDLCLTTESGCDAGGEVLLSDPLIWVGSPGGCAWTHTPLPVALGDEHCAFRAPTLKALAAQGRDWRRACEAREMQAIGAVVEADLAIAVFMRAAVPPNLLPVPPEAGLPALPRFNVNLYLRKAEIGPVVAELARQIRRGIGPARAAGHAVQGIAA